MSVNEVANVSVDEQAEGATLASFDLPAALAAASDTTPTTYGSARAKAYDLTSEGVNAMAEEWGNNSKIVANARRMLAQEPRPAQLYAIKREAPVATVKKIAFTGTFGVGSSAIITVNGVATASVPYQTAHSNTVTAIAAAISGLSNAGVASAAAATNDINVTASPEWPLDISVQTAGPSAPTAEITVTTAGRTAADDVAAALAEDDTNKWYGLCDSDNHVGVALVLSAFMEGTEKDYFVLTNEIASKTAGGTTSLAYRIGNKGLRRTVGFWHHDLTQCLAAGALAVWLSREPGADHLAMKEVAGVDPTPTSALDTAGRAVVEGRNFNTYRKFGDAGAIRKGKRADGKVAEATRDLDYCVNDLRVRVLLYSRTPKPPFDEGGFATFMGVLEGAVKHWVDKKIARVSPAPTISIPNFATLTPQQLDAQIIPNSKIKFNLLKGMIGADITLQPTI